MKRPLVVVSDERHTSYEIERSILEDLGAEFKVFNCQTEADVIEKCSAATGILLDMAPMSSSVVDSLQNCKIISRYGVGYDNVDVAKCTRADIWVANVPDYCADDVAEHALALLLACVRQIPLRDRLVRSGMWNISSWKSYRIAGKTFGILGAGQIAQALMKKLGGFGLSRLLVYDPYMSDEAIFDLGAEKVDLEGVLRESDFISLHMPVTEETRGIINQRTLSMMKSTAVLINTGRGPLIEDEALVSALKNNQIAFAGLDTHNTEPIHRDSELLHLDNCVLTDHTAYYTEESIVELKTKAALNVAAVLRGEKPLYAVNKLE